jgi:hypothetical protein
MPTESQLVTLGLALWKMAPLAIIPTLMVTATQALLATRK